VGASYATHRGKLHKCRTSEPGARVGPRASSSSGCHHPPRGYMAHHKAPCPRARSHGCSVPQRHPRLRVATKEQGCPAPLLAVANRALPVLTVTGEEAEVIGETNLGVRDDAHGSFSGCRDIRQIGYSSHPFQLALLLHSLFKA